MKINEIFYSIQGEGLHIGRPAIFVRMSGCNLYCNRCDTEHTGGIELTISDVIDWIASLPHTNMIVITGGEPLHQGDAVRNLAADLRSRYSIHIETNGTFPINMDDPFDWITVSPKKEFYQDYIHQLELADEVKVPYPLISNYAQLDGTPMWQGPGDQVLWVIPWAKQSYIDHIQVLDTLKWVKQHPQWRFSPQLHKLIGVR